MNGSAVDAMNVVSSDAPRTISGVDIGRKMSRLVPTRPAELIADQGQRDERPEDGRDDRRDERDDEAVADRLGQAGPAERIQPGVDARTPRHVQVGPTGRVVEAERRS